MAVNVTPSTEATSLRVTVADPQRQEQRVSRPSHLDIGTLTVTLISNGEKPYVSEELKQEFNKLTAKWRGETAYISLASEQANNFAYQQIIGMGKEVLPLIFAELKETTSDWFWALRAITRAEISIKPEHLGNVHKVADAWLAWGKQHGYCS